MFDKLEDQDTICAISTAPGTGGIAVLRVSGQAAYSVGRRLCGFLPTQPESHRIYYGILKSVHAGSAIDEVLVSCFAEGRSFTGEETIEISCHGGQALTSSILSELIFAGSRLARPGEFTYRAFLNGRLDLVQAESVLALIESQSKQSAKVALRQLQGSLSNDFRHIEDDLVWILAQLEASIDFSAEDIEVIASEVLTGRTSKLIAFVQQLLGTYRAGRIIKDGLHVALIGAPNAGKSSLLNAFLKEDRAIVTPHAGTTRDPVEGRVSIGGVAVTLIDTAGIRETNDEIEKIGIAKSRGAMASADVVFHLIDLCDETWQSKLSEARDEDLRTRAAGALTNRYFVLNKIDLIRPDNTLDLYKKHPLVESLRDRVHWISVSTQQGIARLEAVLNQEVAQVVVEDQSVVTQARHLECLSKILDGLVRSIALIKECASPEFVAFELQEAVRIIHELLGQEFDEQVIDRIFKEFCLGK